MVLFEMGKVYPKQEELCFQALCWDFYSKSKVTIENYSCDHHNKQGIDVTLLLFVFIQGSPFACTLKTIVPEVHNVIIMQCCYHNTYYLVMHIIWEYSMWFKTVRA